MGQFKKLDIDELEQHFELMNEEAQKKLKGGCRTCDEWLNTYPGLVIYTEEEYNRMCGDGTWKAGAVCGMGMNVMGGANVLYYRSNCSWHNWPWESACGYCYMGGYIHCDRHGKYFSGFAYCDECYTEHGDDQSNGESDVNPGDDGSGSGSGSDSVGGGNSGPGSGGGGGNTSGDLDIRAIVDASAGSSLGAADKEWLINMLEQIQSKKIGQIILQAISNKGSWMKFEIGETVYHEDLEFGTSWWAPATYNTSTNTMTFNSSDDIGYPMLAEELVHASQRSIYGDKMVSANPNYEFEAKVIRDVMQNSPVERASFSETNDDRYSDFIFDLEAGKLSVDEAVEEYKQNYQNWNDPSGIKQGLSEDSPYYSQDSQSNSFDPKLLKEIVAQITSKNKSL